MASGDHDLIEGLLSLCTTYVLKYWHQPRRSGEDFRIESIGNIERYSVYQSSVIYIVV